MSSRYRDRIIFTNNDARYADQLKKRKINFIKHFSTPKLRYPKPEDLEGVTFNVEIYKVGDRFYKYSQKYYGDPTYWWVIAHFNQKPMENLVNLGDTIYIPTPLTKILETFEEE
jgi:hypothetical protein